MKGYVWVSCGDEGSAGELVRRGCAEAWVVCVVLLGVVDGGVRAGKWSRIERC